MKFVVDGGKGSLNKKQNKKIGGWGVKPSSIFTL